MISALPQSDREEFVCRSFWRACRPVRLRSLPVWAESEIRLPDGGPHGGFRYKLDRLPYAKLLLPQLGKWRRHVICGPTQSGKSLHAFAMLICYYLFEVKEDVIVGLPDLTMAGDKWEKDIKPIIAASQYARFLPKKGSGSQGGKPVLVVFGNGRTLRFMGGGGNDKQRASATAKILIVTESDGIDEISASSKEGQNKIDQLEGRTRAHGLEARNFFECTLTTKSGFTWKEYHAGTRSKIMSRCVHCQKYVAPEREHLVGWDQAETKIEAGEKAAFSCPECGQLINEADRVRMNHDSVLVHRGQEVTPEGEVVGELPKTDTLGFRWSAFHNLLTPIALLGMQEWAAAHSEDPQAAEITQKQQVWAIPADDDNAEKTPLTIAIVRGSAPGYAGRLNGRDQWAVPEWTTFVTAHIDVGMRILNWSVNAHGPRNLRDVIAYGATPTEQPDLIGPEEAILQGLHRVREIIELNCDPSLVLVDCGYQGNEKKKNPRRAVYEFILSCGPEWQASMGLATWTRKEQSDSIEPALTGAPWYYSKQIYVTGNVEQSLWVVDFDPNHFKHLAHGSYQITPTDKDAIRLNGSVTLFGVDPKTHNEFAAQLNNERFEVDHKTGRAAWKRHGHNHFFDTDVGNLVARSVLESLEMSQRATKQEAQTQTTYQTPDGRAFFVGNR